MRPQAGCGAAKAPTLPLPSLPSLSLFVSSLRVWILDLLYQYLHENLRLSKVLVVCFACAPQLARELRAETALPVPPGCPRLRFREDAYAGYKRRKSGLRRISFVGSSSGRDASRTTKLITTNSIDFNTAATLFAWC